VLWEQNKRKHPNFSLSADSLLAGFFITFQLTITVHYRNRDDWGLSITYGDLYEID